VCEKVQSVLLWCDLCVYYLADFFALPFTLINSLKITLKGIFHFSFLLSFASFSISLILFTRKPKETSTHSQTRLWTFFCGYPYGSSYSSTFFSFLFSCLLALTFPSVYLFSSSENWIIYLSQTHSSSIKNLFFSLLITNTTKQLHLNTVKSSLSLWCNISTQFISMINNKLMLRIFLWAANTFFCGIVSYIISTHSFPALVGRKKVNIEAKRGKSEIYFIIMRK
jgi:hypothetical protein